MTSGSSLRLSFLCHEFPPIGGGASTALDALTTELAARGHSIQIVTLGPSSPTNEAFDSGRTVVRLPSGRVSSVAPTLRELAFSFLALRRHAGSLVEGFAPDAIVAFFAFPAGRVAVSIARKLTVPLIVSLRGSDVPGFRTKSIVNGGLIARLVLSPVWRRADVLVANGQFLADLAEAFDPKPVLSIANGVDTDRFFPHDTPTSPKGPLRILVVGQLIERKRPLLALRAAEEAARRGVTLALTFAGDGPLASELTKALDSSSGLVSGRVLGQVAREVLPSIYKEHDVLLHPSAAEGVSNAVLEALASGIPLVATPRSISDLHAELADAAIVVPADPVYLADALYRLATNPDIRERMGQAARSIALGKSWARVAGEWERHIQLWTTRSG